MARSPYWPHPIYLDIYILFIYLITGCSASETNAELIGIIAGSIFAFVILVVGIVGLVYCLMKSQKSREAKKVQVRRPNNNMDYRTVVVRGMPPASVRHPTIVGHPDVMVQYHQSVNGQLQPKLMSRMSTMAHLPANRPPLVPMGYYTARPVKLPQSSRGKYIEDRKSKRTSRPRSKQSMPNSISSHKIMDIEVNSPKAIDSWRDSQFILRKKEDSFPKPVASSRAKLNEPYALTSLFNRTGQASQKSDPPPEGTESRFFLPVENNTPKEGTETYEPVGLPLAYVQQRSSTQEQRRRSPTPVRSESPEIDFEIKDITDPTRPITPDYDVNSIMDEEGTNPDISFASGNKFSYALTEELRQNSRFRNSSNTEDPPLDTFGNMAMSSIETSRLNPGSYGNIPPAPPLPPK